MKLNGIKGFTWDYVPLAAREYQASRVTPGSSVAFVGAGPVPFTSILFMAFNLCQQQLPQTEFDSLLKACESEDKQCIDRLFSLLQSFSSDALPSYTCIDISAEAIEKAQQLVAKLEIEHAFTFQQRDAFAYQHFIDFDVVHIAAMIPHKKQLLELIVDALAESSAQPRVLVRRVSSRDPRRLFYEPLDLESVEAILQAKNVTCSINEFNPEKNSPIMTGHIILTDFSLIRSQTYA